MAGMLRVDVGNAVLAASPSNSFLADEVASTCPLLTPSPPTNALVNPLPEPEESNFLCVEDLASKLQHVQDDGPCGRDSASSSSSALAEPACTQLLSNHNHYLHITKDENSALQEIGGKTQPLQMTFRNSPDHYFFMKWNWPLIRKISVWVFLSSLIAMVALVVTMVSQLPKTCNPPTEWYQGNLMYEIFPASFHDANEDGTGDFRGISLKADYIRSLGVRAVRLNSIFATSDYPENYKNVTSLVDIAHQLGNLTDFTVLVNTLHSKNISIILDIPLWPVVKKLGLSLDMSKLNESDLKPSYEFYKRAKIDAGDSDVVANALMFWVQRGVDGFYLKDLIHFVDDPHLILSLRHWKKIVGQSRALIVNYDLVEVVPQDVINILLNNVDLVDIRLEVKDGVDAINQQLQTILNGTMFSKANMPWIHWSLGDENSVRLADRLTARNATLGATLLQLMLPGTPSIFYGDEIGLHQILDTFKDRKDVQHLHQLGAMVWQTSKRKNSLSWMHGQPTPANFAQLELISKMVSLRSSSPSIYVNAVTKDGDNKANAEVKYAAHDLLVIQRWYPRRKSYVVVSNLGYGHINKDLSTLLYSGEVVVGPRINSRSESISFKEISLWPGESVIVLLD